MVPLVVLPIIVFGRRVRRLSRQTQDRIAEVSAYAEESLHAVRTVQAFTHEAVDRQFGARIDAGLTAAFAYPPAGAAGGDRHAAGVRRHHLRAVDRRP